ncbi:MAG: pantetheine-phosphate adenylyltransferase [Oscillospiraceae bacterium]|jgi:pantetheine-phosphate adenylyltransferase|nr:pantetheine-phosphate adenylyltransferase [Oscillospiraceae bacterium]
MLAIYPGSFDPVTVGHLDIIIRAAKIFDRVIVAVLQNPSKIASFTSEERVMLLRRVTAGMENVEIESFHSLLADFAIEKGAQVIVKGLRAMSDFEYEFQMALANRHLNPDVETVFLTSGAENMFISSSMVKQIAGFGGNIDAFVPMCISEDIKIRLNRGVSSK